MRRTAGSVGCGGGPGREGSLFPPPAGLLEPQMLQKSEGDHRHQRVAVQSDPGATLEVVEPQFLFHLLVGLLAHPTRLDRRRQLVERRVGRQIGQVVLLLARGTPSPEGRRSPTSPTSAPGRCQPLRSWAPSAGRTRKAANSAASGPLVPCRQLIRRQSALASTASAARGASLGTGCLRGRPAAVGQCSSSVGK